MNMRELLRAVGRLPSNQRTALTLREFEGRSYPEIASSGEPPSGKFVVISVIIPFTAVGVDFASP